MTINRLTDKRVKSLKTTGNHPDGGNLYLRVRENGTKSFIIKATVERKQREWTIGQYGDAEDQVTLAKARLRRDEIMSQIRSGDPALLTPKTAKVKKKAPPLITQTPTFGPFAMELVKQIEQGFRNEKHRAQWRSTLTSYCQPIWERPVDQITTEDVLAIIRPMWSQKCETASRLRARIERVLNAAKVMGHRTGENPAAWHGHLQLLLPQRQKLQRGHHPAMPYSQLPSFWRELQQQETVASRALQFLILTAVRSGEVRGATWGEIDSEKKVWVIPANRMKTGKEHSVPLSDASLEILSTMKNSRLSDYVFPGSRPDSKLSDMTLGKLLKSLRPGFTVHGFRSSFRDWCGEETDFSREHAEACLAHSVGSAVERAYRRGNSLERRRTIMATWADYIFTGCTTVATGEKAA
ncbi:MAG: integrase arm-type DNA-binding domain-containing protein [Rhizobiales bacterium]|nr:integrase arm-type DNA-binding domain-containing protein [Hyphomicrobiales bacterium]